MATKRSTKKNAKKEKVNHGKVQATAVILFAISIFFFCVAIIKGNNVWNFMHDFVLGVFGIIAYVWPVILCIVAILCSAEKLRGDIYVKIIESCALIGFLGGIINVLSSHNPTENFWEHLITSYNNGVALSGSGFVGALFGHPFYCMFGKVGAAVFLILIVFVLIMLITGTTLLSFFRLLSKPVKKVEAVAENTYNQKIEALAAKKEIQKKKVNVDIPMNDEEELERERNDLKTFDEKKQLLIDTYNGVDAAGNYIDSEDKEAKKKRGRKAKVVIDDDLIAPEPEEESDDIIKKVNESITAKKNIEQQLNNAFEDLEKNEGSYVFPPINLLSEVKNKDITSINKELEMTAKKLVDTLRSFGVETRILDISRGPAVTRYELQPSAGVKISKITNLSDDIALNLATAGVRIEAPIPNKSAVGIEVPNKQISVVGAKEIIESPAFNDGKSKLTIALGKDIAGEATVFDISKMPHGLIAGATGSGKSVCINSIILSILYKASPEDVKLLLIDPKVVELGIYNGIPHLLVPVVTDPRKASGALGWAVTEMENRYKKFAEYDVRNIAGYNKLAEKNDEITKMPHIVIIIDELADLMMTAPNEVEDAICRIAQKARAAGMHLIVATQRPSVDVVTGLIKANIPTRIAFAVSSQIDSRTILDVGGAEKLLGRGDMLFYPVGAVKPHRVQGCFVSDEDVEKVVEFVKSDHSNEYSEDIMNEIERQAAKEKGAKSGLPEDNEEERDVMLEQAIEVVVEAGQASTSLLQRKLKLGYARAARIIDQMEARGVVGPYAGSKPREVLLTKAQLMEKQATGMEDE